MSTFPRPSLLPWLVLVLGLARAADSRGDDTSLQLHFRSRTQTAVDEKQAVWDAKKTALIICDMWDDHWCKSAARRVGEMAGPLNEVVKIARAKGVFIIHAPSTCTDFYKDTPQRKRAQAAPFSLT